MPKSLDIRGPITGYTNAIREAASTTLPVSGCAAWAERAKRLIWMIARAPRARGAIVELRGSMIIALR
jgi:hypothetical protein